MLEFVAINELFSRETESEKSYSLSEKESEFTKRKNVAAVKPKEKVPKLKKRESFKERLKASLARGNTPDIESGKIWNYPAFV